MLVVMIDIYMYVLHKDLSKKDITITEVISFMKYIDTELVYLTI